MNLTMMSQVVIQKQTLGLPELSESSLLKELAFTASQSPIRPRGSRTAPLAMEDVKSLMAAETEKCLNSIQEILSKSTNGSGNQSQWGQGQGYRSQRGRGQPRGGRVSRGGYYRTVPDHSRLQCYNRNQIGYIA